MPEHLVLTSPKLYVDWLDDQPIQITWTSFGNDSNQAVRIDLYQVSPNGPQFVTDSPNAAVTTFLTTIVSSTPDDGSYTWIAADSGINYGTYGLLIQISLVGNPAVFDRSTETFTVPEDTNTYYVSPDGSNRNDGALPSAPKPLPNNVLRIYSLGPSDTLSIAAGNYALFSPIVISDAPGIGNDEGFTLTGPTAPGSEAVLQLANPAIVAPIITVDDASNVTIENLPLVGGEYGILAINGSTDLNLFNLTVTGSTDDGIRIDSSSSLAEMTSVISSNNGGDGIYIGGIAGALSDITAISNAGYGIYILGSLGSLDGSTVSDNQNTGIYLGDAGAATVEGSDVEDNRGDGIYVYNSGPGTTVIGDSNVDQGLGNIVEGNALGGIEASGAVSVAGNAISGSAGGDQVGLYLASGATATSNVIYGNAFGIYAYGAGNLVGNRVYENSSIGIYSDYPASILMNVVYSNALGIQTAGSTSNTEIANNLVYANANGGVLIESTAYSDSNPVVFLNNTVYQPTGNAVQIDDGTSYVHLTDNILWTFAGFDISVSSDSQVGFKSDYNDLMTSDSGEVGQWQGVGRPNLLAWQSAGLIDADSMSVDPLFVNPLGVDGYLGYNSPTDDGRDDDFHEQSLYGSFHGGSLAPAINLSTGRPMLLTPVVTNDPNESPVIDRGDPAVSFQNEPLPNGNFVNLGAYGNTVQASLSPSQYVIVTSPDGGEAWPEGQTFDIEWRSQDSNSPNDVTVDITLLQVGDPTPILQIANQVPNDGVYQWTVPSTLPPGNSYLVQVTREDGSELSSVSSQPFSITLPIHTYYVNSGTVFPGGYATEPGSDANDGLTPATPKASIAAILASYQLNPGDTILVDAGTYNVSSNIVLDAVDSGIVIEGYSNPDDSSQVTLLNRGNTNQGEYVFDLQGATDVTLENLEITGGSYGINASDGAGSTGLTVSNSILDGNLNAGAYIGVGNDNPTFVNDTIYGDPANLYVSASQPEGLGIDANGAVVTGNTIFDSSESGLSVYGSNVQVTGNTVYGNETGIFISGSGVVSGNKVFDNEYNIYASSYSGLLSVLDNAVYGSIGTNSSGGIYASNATVTGNAVYGILGTGIEAADSTIVEENQVYDNTGDGILAESADDTISGNHVYANNIGIDVEDLDYATGLVVSNNVVEGNATYGIHAAVNSYGGNTALQLLNNTVIQETGNAIQVDSGSNNVQLLNNILWAQSGYDILVAPDSEVGFQSDYNDLYTTGMGQIGWWEGQSFSSVADWYYELGLDGHSITSEPQFVDPAGPDGIMGYSAAPVGSPQVIDTSSASGFSTTGSWTVNNGGGYAGSYLTTPAGDGSTTASWTFSGLTPGATYEIAVSWPTNASESDYYNSYNAPFTVLDSGLPIGLQRVDQVYPPNVEGVPTVADNGTVFQVLGTFQVTGTSLTVVLSNEANGTVEADAAWLQQIVGNHGADDNFHLLPSSPAVAAGEPNSAVFRGTLSQCRAS